MDYTNVTSSTIMALGYDDERSMMGVIFNSGAEYHYAQVPKQVYRDVLDAPGVGHAFHTHIRVAGYKFTRIR
jgi:hypothetical protein